MFLFKLLLNKVSNNLQYKKWLILLKQISSYLNLFPILSNNSIKLFNHVFMRNKNFLKFFKL